jgi:hypothetical protein
LAAHRELGIGQAEQEAVGGPLGGGAAEDARDAAAL